METLLAGTLRGTAATGEPGELSGDPAEVLGPSARACTEYLSALSVVAIVTYLLLYLVKPALSPQWCSPPGPPMYRRARR